MADNRDRQRRPNFKETGSQQTRFIAVTGYKPQGHGNACGAGGLLCPELRTLLASRCQCRGSAAWGMTLKALA